MRLPFFDEEQTASFNPVIGQINAIYEASGYLCVHIKWPVVTLFVKVTEADEQEERQFATSEDAETRRVPAEEAVPKPVPRRASEKRRVSEPPNAYDFGQMINALNANKDKAACADLLTVTDPKTLPALLSNKLEGETLLIFIQSLEHYIAGKDPGLAYQHLFYLSKAERFKVRTYTDSMCT